MTTPRQAPSPREDVVACVDAIEGATSYLRYSLRKQPASADALREFIDRVRNKLQALEGCLSELENGGQVNGD